MGLQTTIAQKSENFEIFGMTDYSFVRLYKRRRKKEAYVSVSDVQFLISISKSLNASI